MKELAGLGISTTVEARAFVVSLARSRDRSVNVQRLIADSPLPCVRWDAVDGASLTEEEIAAVYTPGLHAPRYPFPLSRGEVGCFLSHRAIWKNIVDSSLDFGLVLEDDIELLPGFAEAVGHAIVHSPEIGYVQFPAREVKRPAEPSASNSENRILRLDEIPLGAVAQLISRPAAERLLRSTETFDRPVDTFVQMHWLHGVDVVVESPAVVREISDRLGGSLIHPGSRMRSLGESVSREVKRFVYKRKLQVACRRYRIVATGSTQGVIHEALFPESGPRSC